MKSLDLKQIGLQELTTVETRSVDGGLECPACWWLGLALAVIDHLDDLYDGIVDGMNAYENQVP